MRTEYITAPPSQRLQPTRAVLDPTQRPETLASAVGEGQGERQALKQGSGKLKLNSNTHFSALAKELFYGSHREIQ